MDVTMVSTGSRFMILEWQVAEYAKAQRSGLDLAFHTDRATS